MRYIAFRDLTVGDGTRHAKQTTEKCHELSKYFNNPCVRAGDR